MKSYDAIIIGAGHNGLVCANYLSKAGKRVLILERRETPGGTLVTEEINQFKIDSVQTGMLRPDILSDLGLAHLNLKTLPWSGQPAFTSLLPNSARLVLDADPARSAESIKPFSEKDAACWPKFLAFMSKASAFLEVAYQTPMPQLVKPDNFLDALPLAKLGIKLRAMGRQDMLNIIRALPMTAVEFVEEWFESQEVKAAVASLGIYNVTLGVMSAGTGFNLIHNWLNRGGLGHRYLGLAGQLTVALVRSATSQGVEILLESEVAKIKVEAGKATGVVLVDGKEISAETIISGADPRQTFLSLVGPMDLAPTFVWNVQSIKMRGSVSKVHLGVRNLPKGLSPFQTYVIAPSLMYLEKAYDSAKYGEISEKPYLEITTTQNVISIHLQFTPYKLKNDDWLIGREKVENLAVNIVSEHFPDLEELIITRHTITPNELEASYALTEGDLNHGQIMLDQFMFMRPLPGWSDHKTPIQGLYLCGSGVHAGGGISGASGRNAAKVILGGG